MTRGKIYGDGLLVATLDPPRLEEEVAMKAADAHLIAAAPELLAALQTLVFDPHDTDPQCWAKAREAIEKATGGAA
tara:strand:- start:561 stop:788 length:228 start_codon:yes stop_codon:yes gene_type:complete